MKLSGKFWVLLSLCFSAGLWMAAPSRVVAQEDCRTFHTIRLQCLVGEGGQMSSKGTCSCGDCDGGGMPECDDFDYDDCTIWADWRDEWVTIDMYECVGSGSCSCGPGY
jgi:hypothetical protein